MLSYVNIHIKLGTFDYFIIFNKIIIFKIVNRCEHWVGKRTKLLQGSVNTSSPSHPRSPGFPFKHSRVLVCNPPSQDFEQVDHELHDDQYGQPFYKKPFEIWNYKSLR